MVNIFRITTKKDSVWHLARYGVKFPTLCGAHDIEDIMSNLEFKQGKVTCLKCIDLIKASKDLIDTIDY